MHTVQVYIDETLEPEMVNEVKQEIMALPHVLNVEMNISVPHEMVIDFEENYNIPMEVMQKRESIGLHPDIISA